MSVSLSDRETSIVKLLHGSMMDFRVHNAAKLETCVDTMMGMFDRVLTDHETQKFRKVRRLVYQHSACIDY